ncbi:MAG: DUF362 domain-containing protein [Theionarchaea archaeon]|nr:DUF362 domain-containing protein [Theionarchaea archaeon]
MRNMSRREFFAEGFGLLLGVGLLKNVRWSRFSKSISSPLAKSNLFIGQNGTPQELLTAALNGFGGIQKVVKRGQKVVVKVNISFNRTPDQAATTNPVLVEALVKMCREAGAREVLVLDHTIDNGKMCLDSSQMEEAVKRGGGKMKVINSERDYREVEIPQGRVLKMALVSEDVLDADVFINVPIAKVHNSATTTLSMKNLMGIVWDRGEFHWKGLHQCIADISTLVKPDLIILDAYRILMTGGPGGPGRVKDAGEVVIGIDPVAVDTYGSVLLEKDPDVVRYIQEAADRGVGLKGMENINAMYVDAQAKEEEKEELVEEEKEEPVEAEPEEEVIEEPVEEVVESEEPVSAGEPAEEEENEAGIPAVILIPALIVSFLIGLRMRRMKRRENTEM